MPLACLKKDAAPELLAATQEIENRADQCFQSLAILTVITYRDTAFCRMPEAILRTTTDALDFVELLGEKADLGTKFELRRIRLALTSLGLRANRQPRRGRCPQA